MPKNKSFGITFSLFFLFIFIVIYLYSGFISYVLIFFSFLFFFISLTRPYILYPLNLLWFKFAILLSKIMSPIILLSIFYFLITPIGFVFKIFNIDILKLKFTNHQTYWIKNREDSINFFNE